MNADVLRILRCPSCSGHLVLLNGEPTDGPVERGDLQCSSCRASFPVHRGVARFVPPENYTTTFGFQWNRFRRTQLDSYSGQSVSRDRFFRESGWRPADLAGKMVLDVGCGAGRFTEVALSTGATVVAIDYSAAVDACRANFAGHPRLSVLQCDIYRLPFATASFDFVFCFGVLQHTPDVRAAFMALREPLRPGGRLAVDLYPMVRTNILWPKYWLRPLTRRMPAHRLLASVERLMRVLFPISLYLGRVPLVGRKLRYAIPVANYDGQLPLSRAQLEEWAILDTFDMLSPRYDQPQTPATVRNWFEQAGLERIEVFRDGLVVGRGVQPSTMEPTNVAAAERRSWTDS